MNPSPTFQIRLFGSPSIATEDGSPMGGRAVQRHRLALLALLALAPGRAASRDRLMAYLWPESDAEHARQLLNQAVYHLRKALGDEALLSSGDDLRLSSERLGVDVLEFEAALARNDHEGAIRLYSGPFLDGFFLSDAPEFEKWVARERERLAGTYAVVLEALAEAAEERQDSTRAVEWWKARAAHDLYDSRVALRLIGALEASGNRAGALQHAALHERLLQEEFGVRPPPELLALVERLRTEPPRSAEPPPPVREEAVGDAPPVVATPGEAAPPETPPPASPPRPPARRRLRSAAVGVVVLLAGGAIFAAIRSGSPSPDLPAAPSRPSIAVLPLASTGTDPQESALADGMTEELIATLGRSGGMRVIASTSVFAFRDRKLDVRSIADSLRVAHVLEGGVQRSGSRLRVRVRLVDARDRSTRWSQTYDRELSDVLAVQDEIAGAVAREVGLRLGQVAGSTSRRRHTRNLAAYDLYLRGSDRTRLRSDSAAREGLEHFRQAVALDSTYAAAWAGLGRMYNRVGSNLPARERERYYRLAEQAVQKALALDESLAEAHGTLGAMRMRSFDLASAERHLKRAIALDPTRALTHEWMVALYLWTGRPEEALAQAERALDLDPLSPTAHAELAHALLHNDRCDEALVILEKLAGLRPPLLRVAPITAQCYALKGMWPEAIAVLRPQAESGNPSSLAPLGYMLARSGRREEALRVNATLLERWRSGDGTAAFQLAMVYAGLGDLDQAFTWLDRAAAHRLLGGAANPAHLMIMGPLFEELHRDPRFETVGGRIGIGTR